MQVKNEGEMEQGESQESLMNVTAETCEQMALGLRDYFDVVLGNLLLYKFERLFYKKLYEKELIKLPESKNSSEGKTIFLKFIYGRISNQAGGGRFFLKNIQCFNFFIKEFFRK